MSKELNFEEDMEIDPSALDVESLEQASKFYSYSAAEAEAKKTFQIAWEEVKTIRSDLILQARDDKTLKNAQAIEAFYRSHVDYLKAKAELTEAEYEKNLAEAACWAMRQKKDMIENLTRLALSDYFARPTVPRDLAEESEKNREGRVSKNREKAAGKLKRNK